MAGSHTIEEMTSGKEGRVRVERRETAGEGFRDCFV